VKHAQNSSANYPLLPPKAYFHDVTESDVMTTAGNV